MDGSVSEPAGGRITGGQVVFNTEEDVVGRVSARLELDGTSKAHCRNLVKDRRQPSEADVRHG